MPLMNIINVKIMPGPLWISAATYVDILVCSRSHDSPIPCVVIINFL